MKKVLFLIITVFFFSCDNDDLATKINESNDLYIFQSIEYFLEEGDSMTIVALPDEPLIVENPDSITIYYEEFINKSPYDTLHFCFYPDTYLPYILKPNESLLIPIPEKIEGNEIKLSSEAWKYSEEKTVRLVSTDSAKKMEIPPYCRLTSNDWKEKMTVTYIATFTGMVTGNEVKLKGKWKSECIKYDECKIDLAEKN